jgi:diguanylate cyclase (GGDEF)-like protein
MQAQLRFTDIAARYGGDEFVVMLPDTPLRGALEVAERMRRAIEEAPFAADDGRVPCTVSIGAASFPEHGRTLDALMSRADRALYQAKSGGRNRIEQAAAASAPAAANA